jgi:hypothetical protein
MGWSQCCGSGIRCFLPLDPRWVKTKKSGSGSGMNNPNHISESIETIFWLKILYLNSLMRIRDPGWKKFGSGINIPDPQHCWSSTEFACLAKKTEQLFDFILSSGPMFQPMLVVIDSQYTGLIVAQLLFFNLKISSIS